MTKKFFKIKCRLCALCSLLGVLLLFACASTSDIKDLQKAEAHYKFGYSYLQGNELKKAFVEFQQAVKLNPKDKDALNAIGLILSSPEFGEYEKSVRYFKRAIAIDPDYSDAMNNLGVAYVRMEKWDTALKYFKRALKNPLYMNPESAYSNMGYVFYKKGEYTAAVNTLQEAISKYPDFPRPFYILGMVYMELGKVDDAIAEFKKALDLAPRYMDVHWELANAYLRTGDNVEAIKHFEIVAEGSSDDRREKALEYLELLRE